MTIGEDFLINVTMLNWDSNFFGFPVAQVLTNRLDENSLNDVMGFCRDNKVRLLQFKCDAHHRPSVLIAEDNNFHFADVRITLEKKLTSEDIDNCILPNDISFRLAERSDIPVLKEIVTDLYTNSRYYFDTNFPRDDVHGFYRNWIEKSVLGNFDDCVWVLCLGGKAIACCSISYNADFKVKIGLFAVDTKESKKGLGIILLRKVLCNLVHREISNVSVVTQGRNYSAQRLYQRAGFQTKKIEIYYHSWFNTHVIGTT